jgi:mannose/fructose/N-acetylgalactosamine-specific phosphotransferase system component IIB
VSLALVRIDDRLIHGQVVVGWVRHLGADCILVANDAVAADPMQRALLPMAVPPEIEVAIYRVAEAAQRLAAGAHADRKAILLFSSPVDAEAYLRLGGPLERLNVGGMRFAPGKAQMMPAIFVAAEDIKAFRALAARGLPMQVQMVPTDAPHDVIKCLPEEPNA